MTKFREWLSIELISFGLKIIPYPDLEIAMRRGIERTIDEYLDE